MRTLNAELVQGRTVFYRPDYNVPLKSGHIQDDFRIVATLPTLNFLIENGAKIVIGIHIGQPKGEHKEELETRVVAEYLADHFPQHTVRLAHALQGAEIEEALEAMQGGDMLVLPNLRFYPGEEGNDETFAKELAALAEVYVGDAFAGAHRAHASIVGVPSILPSAAGFLLEEEIKQLSALLDMPPKPLVAMMGGSKVSDKIEVIKRIAKTASKILIGGAMANTFLLAKEEDISRSLAEPDKKNVAAKLLKDFAKKIVVAPDYVKDQEEGDFAYIDIGPESVKVFQEEMGKAKTVFWNGSVGKAESMQGEGASIALAEYMAGLKEQGMTTVIAGGDTVELISRLKLRDKFSWVSTGGGAALELLGGEKLPGIEVLKQG